VDPSATVVVSALAAGRVVWDGGGDALIPGRPVMAGEILGHLTASPPPDHASHIEADLAATEAQISAVKADLERIETVETSGLLTAEEESRETAALRTAEAEIRRAEKDLARETALADKGLASQKDVLEARSLIEKARAERSRAAREIERIQAWSAGRFELAEDRVRNEAELARLSAVKESLTARLAEVKAGGNRVLEIRADKGGVLVAVPAPSGSLVEVGSPLVRVHINDSVLVEVRALRADRAVLENVRSVNLLRSGWGAGRTLESLGASTVTRVPLFDPDTGLYGLTYRLKDSASLVPGEVLDAVVTFGDAREELTVPTTSVIEVSTLPYVFVLIAGESFERRRVELGPRVGDRVVIRSGLKADERVVTVGGFDIHVASLTSSLQSHQH
jgi:multidrug efflux pump subunit AcrA (membrane-fusion protein)